MLACGKCAVITWLSRRNDQGGVAAWVLLRRSRTSEVRSLRSSAAPCPGRREARPTNSVHRAFDARVVGPVHDRILDRADALHLAPDPVAGLQEHRRIAEDADTRRGSGRDDVAGLEGDVAADEVDQLRDPVD